MYAASPYELQEAPDSFDPDLRSRGGLCDG